MINIKTTNKLAVFSTIFLILLLPAILIADSSAYAGNNNSLIKSALQKVISFQAENMDIQDALKLLSSQAGINIIAGEGVKGKVNASFANTTVKSILDAITVSKGLKYDDNGSMVILKKERQKQNIIRIGKVFHLKHIDAISLAADLKELFGDEGRIEAISQTTEISEDTKPRSSILVVYSSPEMVKAVSKIVEQVDIPKRQVGINVKFIETNISNEKEYGIDWQKSIEVSVANATLDPDETESGYSALSSVPPNWNSFTLGTLSIEQVTAFLKFLKEQGNSKVISDPRVTTLNSQKAKIAVTTVIPVQTINRFSEGGSVQDIVSYEDLEVGLTLEVTPRITEGDTLVLTVSPSVEEIIDWVGPPGNQRPITSKRSVNTEVAVKNGDTIVLGGLVKETKIETKKKIWLLGDIPILGFLFRSNKVDTKKTDLIIMITPEILE